MRQCTLIQCLNLVPSQICKLERTLRVLVILKLCLQLPIKSWIDHLDSFDLQLESDDVDSRPWLYVVSPSFVQIKDTRSMRI